MMRNDKNSFGSRNEIPSHKMYSICIHIREREALTLWKKITRFLDHLFGH